jgi:ferredoxin
MAFVITRLCRDCVDGACVDVCPTDCIVEHRPKPGEEALPRQLFIDPHECIDCNMCVPECPWEAIYPDTDVPAAFEDDIALNARAEHRGQGFHVPVERLHRRPSAEEIAANWRKWGLSRGGS